MRARVVMKNGDMFFVPDADSLFATMVSNMDSFEKLHTQFPDNRPLWQRNFDDYKKIVTLKTDLDIVSFDFSQISHIVWVK